MKEKQKAELWDRWCAWFRERNEWSRNTFGPPTDRGPIGPLEHLKKEIEEVLKDPYDFMEYIDCLFLICDAMYRAPISLYDPELILQLAEDKLKVNKARKWAKVEPGKPCEHIREENNAEQIKVTKVEPTELPEACKEDAYQYKAEGYYDGNGNFV